MTIYRLGADLAFPPVDEAEDNGLLAVGGDLAADRLLLAYRLGIFPWYEKNPILWFSPDPRMVLRAEDLRVSRSLGKTLRRGRFRITLDTAFERVIEGCARTKRPRQRTTWITPAMRSAYGELHRAGFAHSAEAWQGDKLVGGLYGVSLGGAFFGESMFARAPDASKAAFVALVQQLAAWGVGLIDCQVYTEHLARFGATEWPRRLYLAELRRALRRPTRQGPWAFDPPTAPQPGES
ncbi:MAG TPA: leucyl/phenylalanyl-tRNA--protein transferase [Vicinamibacteria bacterium]|nr:leucyl/phenylalanyl-tRNA--protein transferase [Vicinamibacteria bacterium]